MIFHIIGIACLGNAVFIQTLVFLLIFTTGSFVGYENNFIIILLEVIFSVYALIYYAITSTMRLKKITNRNREDKKLNL